MEKSLNTMSKQNDFIDTTTGEVFTYAALSREDEAAAREDAAIIKTNLRSAAESVITVGQALIRQKAKLPHGMFLPWIDAEFGMTDRTALNFTRVADKYGTKSEIVSDLTASALYELAAPSTPPEIRDRVEEMIVDGEKVTAAQIKRMKAEAKAAREESERLRIEAEKPKPAFQVIDTEAIRTQAYAAAQAAAAGRIRELEEDVEAHADELARLKRIASEQLDPAQIAGSSNVVSVQFPDPYENTEEDEYVDSIANEADEISAFAGGIESIGGSKFNLHEFWRRTGKDGSHGKIIYKNLLSVNAITAALIEEYSK